MPVQNGVVTVQTRSERAWRLWRSEKAEAEADDQHRGLSRRGLLVVGLAEHGESGRAVHGLGQADAAARHLQAARTHEAGDGGSRVECDAEIVQNVRGGSTPP